MGGEGWPTSTRHYLLSYVDRLIPEDLFSLAWFFGLSLDTFWQNHHTDTFHIANTPFERNKLLYPLSIIEVIQAFFFTVLLPDP